MKRIFGYTIIAVVVVGIVATICNQPKPSTATQPAGTIRSRYADCMAQPYPKLSKAARKAAELKRYEACNAEGNAAVLSGLKAVQDEQKINKAIADR